MVDKGKLYHAQMFEIFANDEERETVKSLSGEEKDIFIYNVVNKKFEQQKAMDMFWRIATIENKQELRSLTTAEEKDEYMAKVVAEYREKSKKILEGVRKFYDNLSDTFDKYKATEEIRTKSVVQNYSSMITIAIRCKDFTGGAPIPVEGRGVEITIVYEGVGYYGISIVSGKDKIEKYGITEDDLTPYGRDQLYRISGGSLALMMHDYCMIMHDPKSYYKEV